MPVDKAISAAEANRQFSKILQGVRGGRTYVVTSHGRPVARIAPIETRDRVRDGARAALFKRLDGQRGTVIGPWTRDELYEDKE